MKLLVIGGHSRNIGKTSVMAGLIHASRHLGWTAVKITQYGHGICSLDGKPCGCEPRHHPFELTEETDASGRADTCRYLAAGARRSLWLRARQGQLATAFPLLMEALRQDDYVAIESNSILALLRPDVYLVVLDSSRRDFKPSARQYLSRADAVVPIGAAFDGGAWPGLDLKPLTAAAPIFPVVAGEYFNPELAEFVRRRLDLPDREPVAAEAQ